MRETSREEFIYAKVAELKLKLTGDLFQDGEIMQEIYELKKELNPIDPDKAFGDEDDDGCLFCGS